MFVYRTDPQSSRVQRMVWDHYTEPVPVGGSERFSGAHVYIRRTEAGLTEGSPAETGPTQCVEAAE